jgi:hypothetical protein
LFFFFPFPLMVANGKTSTTKVVSARRTPARPSARRGGVRQVVNVNVNTLKEHLDARQPGNPPLPRAVGPYTTVPVTKHFYSSAKELLVGPLYISEASEPEDWGNAIALASVDSAVAVGGANNTSVFTSDAIGTTGWNDAMIVPASVTVVVSNSAALLNTAGDVFVGRTTQQINWGAGTLPWADKMAGVTAYSAMHPVSAADLNQHPKQVDLLPLDMNAYSAFRPIRNYFTGGTNTTWGANMRFAAFSPAFIHNPTQVTLTVSVTIQYRVRFDPSNPAYGGGTLHLAAPPGYWDRLLAYAQQAGTMAHDVVTSETGRSVAQQAVRLGARLAYQRRGGIQAIGWH